MKSNHWFWLVNIGWLADIDLFDVIFDLFSHTMTWLIRVQALQILWDSDHIRTHSTIFAALMGGNKLKYVNILSWTNTEKIKSKLYLKTLFETKMATTQQELYSNLHVLKKKSDYQKQIVLMVPWGCSIEFWVMFSRIVINMLQKTIC